MKGYTIIEKKEYVIAFVKFRVSINLRECMMCTHFLQLTKNLQWLQRFKLKELDNKWGIRLLNLLFTIF